MAHIEDLITLFVHQSLDKNPEITQRLIDELKSRRDTIFDDIHRTIDRLDYPYDLQFLCFELLKEARRKEISTDQILLGVNVGIKMYQYRKRNEPTLLPIWTGPIHFESPITHKTYDTVRRLFQSAKHEIFIVGYTFSLEYESVRSLFQELINAGRRGCRIEIIYHNNERNLETILQQWPKDLILPDLFYWKGSEASHMASLHSKLIVIDQKQLLLTSANFTLHGFHENIETGVLIENHLLIRQIWEQFRSLLLNDVMVKYK